MHRKQNQKQKIKNYQSNPSKRILGRTSVTMRGLGRFRNSQHAFLPKAIKSRGHLPPLRLGLWQSAVRYLITYPVTNNLMFRLLFPILKKFSLKKISPFGTVKTESENIWICWRWLYKKQQNKEHKQDAALLIGVNLLQQYHIRKY